MTEPLAKRRPSQKRLANGTLRVYTGQPCPACRGGRLRMDLPENGPTRRYCGVCGFDMPVPVVNWRDA